MPTLVVDLCLRLPSYYKTKVWTDFRVRVRTEIRYSSSIISLQ